MKIFILTCPSLANQRLPPIIKQLLPLIDDGLIDDIEIVSGTDNSLARTIESNYDKDKWNDDIRSAWEIFLKNIMSVKSINDKDSQKSIGLKPTSIFPSRDLTESEHSIAMRHIKAIEKIRKESGTCIILEDDVIISDYRNATLLIKSILNGYKKVTFFDLSDNYISIPTKNFSKKKLIGGLNWIAYPIGITRTLMAYAINQDTAKLIHEGFKHYSLPVDMQIQVILKEKFIPGLTINSPLFRHGSKSGLVNSAVHQTYI